MIKLGGIVKVTAILLLDFSALYVLFDEFLLAALITGVIALYSSLGGYLALLKEGGIRSKRLPAFEQDRIEAAKTMLVEDAKRVYSVDISRLKLYLITGEHEMNATAYGANCVSVTRGTLDNTDPVTLSAVLGHEVSHLLHKDAEFSRACLASLTLILASLSIVSATAMVVLFLVFLLFNCFRSWLGVMAFSGSTRMVGNLFRFFQQLLVVIFRTILGLTSRAAEYRADRESGALGYGAQLIHFLSIADASQTQRNTITEILYRSHPPTELRIARLNEQISACTELR